MRRIRSTIAILALTAASLLGTTESATAAEPAPYGPAQPLLQNCTTGQPADAAIASDGTVHGFASCGMNPVPVISYVRFRGSTAFSQPTPYRGRVIKVAWDDLASSYLLFARPGPIPGTEQLFIGKRLDNTGQYAQPTLLTTNRPGGSKHSLRPVQASLAAFHGTWWAVWTEPTAEVSGVVTHSLFQRHTLLSVQSRTRITYPVTGADDAAPSLAYAPRSPDPVLGRLTVIWVRTPYLGAHRGQLRLGKEFGHGWLTSPMPATVPISRTAYVDQISYLGTRSVTWPGTYSVGVATISGGLLRPHLFPTGSDLVSSTVAASAQNLFLLWWTNPGPGTTEGQVVLAERQAGTWYPSATLGGGGDAAVRVLAQGGRGRLVYWHRGTLTLRIQG